MNAITTFFKNFIVKTEKPYPDKCGNDVVIIHYVFLTYLKHRHYGLLTEKVR